MAAAKKYDVLDVAKLVIKHCEKNKKIITNIKLQLVLYYLQGAYFKFKNEYLFDDEFSAWTFGPSVPKAYHYYSPFKSENLCFSYLEKDVLENKYIERMIEVVTNLILGTDIEEVTRCVKGHLPYSYTINNKGLNFNIDKCLIEEFFLENNTFKVKEGENLNVNRLSVVA